MFRKVTPPVTRHEHMRRGAGPRDRFHGGYAVTLFQSDVDQDQIWSMLRRSRHSACLGFCRGTNIMPERAQQLAEQLADKHIIFDHENAELAHKLNSAREKIQQFLRGMEAVGDCAWTKFNVTDCVFKLRKLPRAVRPMKLTGRTK
jgi:hypothetical protein